MSDDIFDALPKPAPEPTRITREQWQEDPDRWTAESMTRAVHVVDGEGRVRMALSSGAPDTWGAWAKAKPRAFRDVFPTPEAFKAHIDAVARRVWQPFPCVTMEIDEGMAPDEWRLENRHAK